jgi:hypothetical protein
MHGIPSLRPTSFKAEKAALVVQERDPASPREKQHLQVRIEELLDIALAATFPASDALSITQPGGG